ncbi:MAPEG family protein [Hyphobacterium sp. HN65]|uniref:MAPEG family protein n=1 Tax=Hyphobacterium lacteum TaxID=3116575 RepID=A0ABU7LN75_9PROT|nr:MAPEG family protein [Hyphobacterium sp. HN65]MEE2525343.1 MAPEG family protein [Hyphobacterium sp. HN65]
MTAMQAVALYAGINLLILALLSVPIGLNRNKKKISLGDGGDTEMNTLIRGHGNAAEWIPGALFGLFLLATMGLGNLVIHGLGLAFSLARGAHAYAFISGQTTGPARVFGASITFLVYLVIVGLLFWKALT